MSVRTNILVVILSFALSACSNTQETLLATPAITPGPVETTEFRLGERRVPGIISYYQEPLDTVVTFPDTVERDTPFEITVSTFGDGCDRTGGADVVISELQAEINVYDYTKRGPEITCSAQLLRLTRTITLTFTEVGEARIIIQGIRVGKETTSMAGVPTVLERVIVVQ